MKITSIEKAIQALNEEVMSSEADIPVAALIYDEKNEVIAIDHNRCEKDDNPLYHAELLVIDKALKIKPHNLSMCTLVVNLEPCPMCAGAMINSGLKKVIYLCRNEQSGAFSFYHLDVQKESLMPIYHEDIQTKKNFEKFFKNMRAEKKL